MLRVQQMPDGLADIIKDYKLKLPSRREAVLNDSIEMQNSRELANMEMLAKKQQNGRILREEVIETSRDTGSNFPDTAHIAAVMQGMNSMGEAQRQQQESLNKMTMMARAQEAAESRAMLERLAAEMTAQRSKDRVAATVTQAHTDAMFADISMRHQAMSVAGVSTTNVVNNYDQTSSTTNNYDQTTNNHNAYSGAADPNAEATAAALANFMKHHHEQFAAYATSTGMTAQKALEALTVTLENRHHLSMSKVNAQLIEQLANPTMRQQFDQGPGPPSGSAGAAGVAAAAGAQPSPQYQTYGLNHVPAPVTFAPSSQAQASSAPRVEGATVPIPTSLHPPSRMIRSSGNLVQSPYANPKPYAGPPVPKGIPVTVAAKPTIPLPPDIAPAAPSMETQTMNKRSSDASANAGTNKKPTRSASVPRAKSASNAPAGTIAAMAKAVAGAVGTAVTAAMGSSASSSSGAKGTSVSRSRGRSASAKKDVVSVAMDGQGARSPSRPPREPEISQADMLVAVSKAAEVLAEDKVPKKKASSTAKKTIPNSKPMVKMTRGRSRSTVRHSGRRSNASNSQAPINPRRRQLRDQRKSRGWPRRTRRTRRTRSSLNS